MQAFSRERGEIASLHIRLYLVSSRLMMYDPAHNPPLGQAGTQHATLGNYTGTHDDQCEANTKPGCM
jgi:hypothetical protein